MKILVTGGAGFIGSHIVEAYLSDGHEVAVLDNLETGSLSNLPGAVQFYKADIQNSLEVDATFRDFRPQVVSHHAALIDVSQSVQNPVRDTSVNILGSLKVLQAARETGVERFVFASSGGAIYGEADVSPTPETASPNPLSPYGLSKLTFERYLSLFHTLGGPNFVNLRYSNVYGPRQGLRGEAGVISVFIKRLLEGSSCTIYGDGTMTRDYIFVDDVVEANRLALQSSENQTFNIGSGREISTRELFYRVRDAVGMNAGEPIYVEERRGEVRRSCLDNNYARENLGWRPKSTFELGLQLVVDSLRVPHAMQL